ncbi:FeoB-associated Cys-rich membrane protein [Agrilactobacillus fermenti]|uniref:FeoB-associated Cys-rich membrane protein n=1 Tax=Agrilactobacillus fermenti TaxID=2586909 RepID=UPI001E3F31BF|nr:FeoB-associated Cys-rich membrane protein [Agrilactobacillus fermenti]MCD2256140.1 FeoB-associated Cys-rich membrane protein [Agrilactobacillus fermenti]
MATVILAILIFGSAAYVIWSRYLKKDRKPACDGCHDVGCPLVAAKDAKHGEHLNS